MLGESLMQRRTLDYIAPIISSCMELFTDHSSELLGSYGRTREAK